LAQLPGYRCRKLDSAPELAALVQDENCGLLRLGLICREQFFLVEAAQVSLAVDVLQPLLDKLLDQQNSEQNGKTCIDYIHGGDELFRLAGKENNGGNAVGILLPPFRKQGLFETVARRGPLPRKSFSMGESCEKRFYLECRKLF